MSNHKDIIPLDQAFPFNLFRTSGSNKQEAALHFHDCLELDFVLSGSGFNQIETSTYLLVAGDIYVINHLEHHMAYNTGDLELLVLVFDPALITSSHAFEDAYLQPFFNRSIRFKNRIASDDKLYHSLKQLVFQIDDEWHQKEVGYLLVIKALLLQLLALLFRHYSLENALSISPEQQQFQKSYDRLREAIAYIHRQYTSEISMAVLADLSSMNKSYFSTFFKQVMGQTVTDYIDALRLQQVRLLLNSSNLSITEIALSCGFSNLSFFNRRFKSYYGCTPSTFKRTLSQTPLNHFPI